MFLKVLSMLSTLFVCINSAISVFSSKGENVKYQLNQVQYKLFTFNETVDSFNDSLFINQLLYCDKEQINDFLCADCNNHRYLVGNYINDKSQSIVVADEIEYEIMIGFKYSLSIIDNEIEWINQNSFYTKWTEGSVHSGFYNEFYEIKENTLSLFKEVYDKIPKSTVVITGHSIGGSIALLFASHMKEIYDNINIYVYTYGSPRTGDIFFSKYILKQFEKNVIRVMNDLDMVPDFPSILQGYQHIGNLIICKTGTIQCYNKYDKYEHDKNPYDATHKLRRVMYSKKNITLSHFTYLYNLIGSYKCI